MIPLYSYLRLPGSPVRRHFQKTGNFLSFPGITNIKQGMGKKRHMTRKLTQQVTRG